MRLRPTLLLLTTLLAGCDLGDIPGLGPDPRIAQREADSKAIGSACRYGLRGIEDCYVLNPKASKAAMFAGWKEMDQYMRENKIDGVASTLPPPSPEAAADKSAEKSGDKAADKAEGSKGAGKAEVKAEGAAKTDVDAKTDHKADSTKADTKSASKAKAKPAADAHAQHG